MGEELLAAEKHWLKNSCITEAHLSTGEAQKAGNRSSLYRLQCTLTAEPTGSSAGWAVLSRRFSLSKPLQAARVLRFSFCSQLLLFILAGRLGLVNAVSFRDFLKLV